MFKTIKTWLYNHLLNQLNYYDYQIEKLEIDLFLAGFSKRKNYGLKAKMFELYAKKARIRDLLEKLK